MKKLSKKLKLNKETISALNNEQMMNVKGGQSHPICKQTLDPVECETVGGDTTGNGDPIFTIGTGSGGGGLSDVRADVCTNPPVSL